MSENLPRLYNYNPSDSERAEDLELVLMVLNNIVQDGYNLKNQTFANKGLALRAADIYKRAVENFVIDCPEICQIDIKVSGDNVKAPNLNIETSHDGMTVNLSIDPDNPQKKLDVFESKPLNFRNVVCIVRNEAITLDEDDDDAPGEYYIDTQMIFLDAKGKQRTITVDNPDGMQYLLSIIHCTNLSYVTVDESVFIEIPELEKIRRKYEVLTHESLTSENADGVVASLRRLDDMLKGEDPAKYKYIDDIKLIFSIMHEYSQQHENGLNPIMNALEEIIGRGRVIRLGGEAIVNNDEDFPSDNFVKVSINGKVETIIQGNPYTGDASTINLVLSDGDKQYFMPIDKVDSFGY